MRIGIDISQVIYEGTGVARFTTGLVNAILDYDKSNDWFFFFSSMRRSLQPTLKNKIRSKGFKIITYKAPPTLISYLWNTIHRLKIERLTGKFDWFITSDWTEPPSRLKKATIVHDLGFLRYPEVSHPRTDFDINSMNISANIVETQKNRLKWVKKESRIIFADSATTRGDIIEYMKIKEEVVKIIYPGLNEVKAPSLDFTQKTLEKYNIKTPFILTVGKIEPRKNLARLIEAYENMDRKTAPELIVVGQRGWDKVKAPSSKIKFLGYVSDEELNVFYKSCLFFIYPSIWEGFGYPVAEAMKSATACATSNTSSLGEIGANAALLFNPLKVDEIQNALERMSSDDKLRKELSKKGLERSRLFTWENYYHELIETLRIKS